MRHGYVGTSCLFFHAWTMNSRNNPFLSFIFKEFVPIQLLGFQTQSSLETQGRSSVYCTSEFTILLYNTYNAFRKQILHWRVRWYGITETLYISDISNEMEKHWKLWLINYISFIQLYNVKGIIKKHLNIQYIFFKYANLPMYRIWSFSAEFHY